MLSLFLDMAAQSFGDRQAIVGGGHCLSFHELRARAVNLAASVHGEGAIAYLAESHPAAAVALYGAAFAGRPYIPINYRLTNSEIDSLLARAQPALVVTDTPREGWRTMHPDEAMTLGDAAEMPLAPDDPGAVAVELFTSGTTGAPKAALLRYSNLAAYVLGTVEFGSAGEDETALVSVPPYHVAGIAALLTSFYMGRRIVLLPAFSPEAWLDTAAKHGVTNAFVVPTMLTRIINHLRVDPSRVQLPSLRAIAYGGGRMPLETISAAMALWPDVAFTNAYGLTETSSTIALLGPDDHKAAATAQAPHLRARLGSVGRALPGVELVIRSEDGILLPPGTPGLVFARGEQVAGEYRGAERMVDSEGWFATRDRGWLDEDGFLFLDGREDDVIVRGGENMSPGEIEDILREHPDVADVAVVGIPDAEWGEVVAAAVVTRDKVNPDELRALVRKRLRSSRVPTFIRFMEALPYNEMGKLLRRVVRDELQRG